MNLLKYTALTSVLALLAGCAGYSSAPLHMRSSNKTVAVPVFDNATFWHDFEFELTDAVAQEVRSRTGYTITHTDRADFVLHGNIIDVSRPVLTEGEQNQVKEGSLLVTVEVTVTDTATGKIVRKRTLKESAAFVIARGESESSARTEAFEDLAENIVNLLEEDW